MKSEIVESLMHIYESWEFERISEIFINFFGLLIDESDNPFKNKERKLKIAEMEPYKGLFRLFDHPNKEL
jgi:hypothetical protein